MSLIAEQPLPEKLENTNSRNTSALRWLKYGIWAFFLLLIFEGALRKWFLPGLATPLLIVRDPVGIWLICKSIQQGKLPANVYLVLTAFIGIGSIYTALFLGHGNLPVAIFGARILLIHFPLMFIIGNVFDRNDVINLGKVTLFIAIPMVILITLQFYSPQSTWVNRGVGGDMEGAGFSGAMGYSRPSGTFSFTNGLTTFFSLVAPFVIFFWMDKTKINKLVLIAATLALLAAVPISISRSLFFSVIVSLIFALAISVKKPKFMGKLMGIGFVGIATLLILSQLPFFQTSTEVFMARFESANRVEGGTEGVLLDRYLGGLLESLTSGSEGNKPFFGYGIGMGTNVGSMLLTGGRSFLISEGEWGRLMGEMGFMLGLIIILVRVIFSAHLTLNAYKHLAQDNMLPWLLVSFALLIIPQGQWAQPTSLGFSTLIGGLIIAAFNKPAFSK